MYDFKILPGTEYSSLSPFSLCNLVYSLTLVDILNHVLGVAS
jgi:hypothetical protein